MKNLSLRHLLTAFLFLFCACRGGTAGPEFLGKWQGIANPTITLEIASRGDKYILRAHDTTGDHQYIASLNDHTLTIPTADVSSKQIYYRENSETLEWGGLRSKECNEISQFFSTQGNGFHTSV